MNRKLLAVLGLCVALAIPTATASWFASLTGNVVFEIQSEEPLFIEIPSASVILNPMTGSGDSATISIDVLNNDDMIGVDFTATETVEEFAPGDCTNNPQDVITTYNLDGVPVASGELLYLDVGSNELNITTDAILYACPQNLTINLTFDARMECVPTPESISSDCGETPILLNDWAWICNSGDEREQRTMEDRNCIGFVCGIDDPRIEERNRQSCQDLCGGTCSGATQRCDC